MDAMLDAAPMVDAVGGGAEPARQAAIRVRGMRKLYETDDGPIEALADITLDVAEGEFVSILGPSGCGKSTLLKCIAGLEPINAGDVCVWGGPVRPPPERTGIVFQRDLLMDWRSVLNNVLVATDLQGLKRSRFRPRAEALLARFGLGDYLHRYPWEMSGGMRQRAAICRALVDDPDMLLMDEPFGALDAMTRDDLNIEMQRMWMEDRKTVLFITHSIPEAVFLSDRVIVMDRNPGRVAADVRIDLPRPRRLMDRGNPRFGELTAHLRDILARSGVVVRDAP
jgi:NitT/TauT family transport system ATP-binding protein